MVIGVRCTRNFGYSSSLAYLVCRGRRRPHWSSKERGAAILWSDKLTCLAWGSCVSSDFAGRVMGREKRGRLTNRLYAYGNSCCVPNLRSVLSNALLIGLSHGLYD